MKISDKAGTNQRKQRFKAKENRTDHEKRTIRIGYEGCHAPRSQAGEQVLTDGHRKNSSSIKQDATSSAEIYKTRTQRGKKDEIQDHHHNLKRIHGTHGVRRSSFPARDKRGRTADRACAVSAGRGGERRNELRVKREQRREGGKSARVRLRSSGNYIL